MKTQTLSHSKILMIVFACILCFTLILQPVSSVFATFSSGISSDGKYYADFVNKVVDAYVGVFTDGKGKLKKIPDSICIADSVWNV